ncbi:glycine cleavage T C-terminal barrel domain-containing protein [Piscinibacter sakaiensis]|uniref:glycine cleavage T C-terminal barrel domain-containing protein n=1 Tax=Piscinibacter sakaiensis TaxID=1547922 RepID=UPI003727A5AE
MTAVSSSPAASPAPAAALATTPLHALHRELGARMVPFAGYDMPVSYPAGILAEHRHCRAAAALFDVSHMGQLRLHGEDAAAALESLVPMDLAGLPVGRQRYAFFTNPAGGLLDDLMVSRPAPGSGFGELFLVVNAACKADDLRHLQTHVGHRCRIEPAADRGLLALQGPAAEAALARLNPAVAALRFMDAAPLDLLGLPCLVTRSGYTGEDGYRRVGLVGLERAPVREGTPIVDTHGHPLGTVTSGTLAPSVDRPIAMAYLPADHAAPAHEVYAEVRGRRLPMRVEGMPFAPHRYKR